MLTYVNDSLTYWLPIRIKTINWLWKALSLLGMSTTTENAQKYTKFYRFLLFTPTSIGNAHFLSISMTFNHLKISSTKFAHYRLKIWKVIEFFTFTPWGNIPLCWEDKVVTMATSANWPNSVYWPSIKIKLP